MKFDIDYVASLAQLRLTAAEKRRFGSQLKSILSYIEKISKLNTDKVPPTFQTTGLNNVVRADKVDSKRLLGQEETLANAPLKKNGFFKVKRVIES